MVFGALSSAAIGAHAGVVDELAELQRLLDHPNPKTCSATTGNQTAADSFCENAYLFICDDDSTHETNIVAAYDAYDAWASPAFGKTIFKAGRKNAAAATKTFIDQAYSEGLKAAGGPVAQEIKWDTLNQLVERVKKQTIQALEKKSLDPAVLADAKAKLEATLLYTHDELVSDIVDLKDSSFASVCNNDGSDPNANFTVTKEGARRILICPALIVGFTAESKDLADFESRIEHVIAHEIAHSVDGGDKGGQADLTAEIYKKELSLLTEDSTEYKLNRATKFEMAADSLSIESQLEGALFQSKDSSRDALANILKHRYQDLCLGMTEKARTHPSARWRITLMADHLAIRNRLGCRADDVVTKGGY